jgi:hypothetical protein
MELRGDLPRRKSIMTVMTTRRGARFLLLALASGPLVGCGEEEAVDPAPHSEVPAADADVRLVKDEQADLMLYASNQSFDDESVRLTIAVDGVTVVDGGFHVEGQHNWVRFHLSLSPGVHEVMAKSDSGATRRESFRVPGDKMRYAVIDYWGEDDSAELTWRFQRRAMAFR